MLSFFCHWLWCIDWNSVDISVVSRRMAINVARKIVFWVTILFYFSHNITTTKLSETSCALGISLTRPPSFPCLSSSIRHVHSSNGLSQSPHDGLQLSFYGAKMFLWGKVGKRARGVWGNDAPRNEGRAVIESNV